MFAYRNICAFMALAALTHAAAALTFGKVSLVCPIDGESFETTMAMSGTQFGQFLDLRPDGPIAAPWPIAKCPTSGFVMYKKPFSEDELALLKPYVASSEYQSLQKAETNYYLAARLQRVLKAPDEAIAFTLLRATWEAHNADQYASYAGEALAAFQGLTEQASEDRKQWQTNQLMVVELLRRLGRFGEASALLARLSRQMVPADATLGRILKRQTQLVEDQDARPHLIPRESDLDFKRLDPARSPS